MILFQTLPIAVINSCCCVESGRQRNQEFSCVCLHGDRKPQERKGNLEKFKVGVFGVASNPMYAAVLSEYRSS